MNKIYKKSALLALLVFATGWLNAQNSQINQVQAFPKGTGLHTPAFVPPPHRTCLTVEKIAESLLQNPELVVQYENSQREIENYLANPANQNKTQGILRIPVVVHVLYRQAAGNISDAQINSQINVLNKDYRRQNTDANLTPAQFLPVAADCGIEFCLATQDPQGNATNGITRTQTSTSNIGSTNSYYTAAPIWDRNKYLNIWVCEIGGGTLGFAYLPGTAPASYDGVVIDYRYFGTMGTAQAPFNKGRTATHEVGHWLNLHHIWADDNGGCTLDDGVADTPKQADENYNCPTNPVSCNNGGDMSMNYMDYTNDACMYMFTQGQSLRMNAALNSTRASLLSSNGCGSGGGTVANCNDSLNLPLAGTPTLYTSDNWGYVAGHNGYGDLSKADYFPNTGGYTSCTGIRLEFAIANSSGPSASIDVHIWDDNGGTPGTILGTETLLIDDIISNAGVVDLAFSPAVTLSGAFYAGISFDYNNSLDTVALICTADGEVSPGISWEEFNDNSWHPYSDATDSWGINVGQAIYPFVTGAPLNIIVNPVNPTITQGNSVNLSASGASTYSWSPGTGLSATTGAAVTASPTATTTYTVTGTDGTCTGTETVTVTVQVPASLSELFPSQSVSVYPNPGDGRFTLEFTSAKTHDLQVEVLNSLGQVLYFSKLDNFSGSYQGEIDLSTEARGIYLLRISDGNRQFVRKLVVE